MKKSLFLLPLLAGSMLCGCGENPNPEPEPAPVEHVHTFSADWTSNATNHWHMATCGHDVKDAEAAHVDANNDEKCDVCGYQLPHVHKFSADWSSDATNHWHASTCGHDVKDAEGVHVDSNGDEKCDVCGYQLPHVHKFSADWSSDPTNHWHAAICGHDVKDALAAHVDANNDEKCDVCAYPMPHVHTFSSSWSSDATNHWHAATCGHDVKDAEGVHVDSNGDERCDVCGYVMPHVHTFSSSWSNDETNHWHDATCGHDVKGSEGAHVDANGDNICDVCGYNMPKPVPAETIVLDFTDPMWKDQKITPYVTDNTTVLQFDYDGISYNDAGCYANSYNDTYWLMMKNKWVDDKVVEGEAFAFIGNADSYGKAIDKIVVTTSKQGGAVDLYVDFGSSAFEASSCKGTKQSVTSSETTFTATNSGDSEYFAITAAKDVGQYRKNGGIAKLEIYLK